LRRNATGSGRCGGFPYLLVYDAGTMPPMIVRFVHQARDLPNVLEL